MTVLSPATWTQYGSYDARNDRLHVSSLLNTEGATIATAFAVTQQVIPSMVLTVGSGAAYINAPWAASQGYYCLVNDAPITVTVQPSDPTYPRIDRVIARVYDAFYEGTETKAQIEIKKGDPAVSPQLPDLPNGSIELARITVGANVSTILTANINNAVMPQASLREALILNSFTPWVAYTPSFSNFTAGASTISARYRKEGKTVHYTGLVTLGAGFAMNSSPVQIGLPLPVTSTQNNVLMGLGVSMLNDAGTATYMAMTTVATATAVMMRTTAGVAISITSPFAWATTDSFSWNMTYETSS